MTLTRGNPSPRTMAFAVRPMEERDVLQCAEIERDAFPAQFPPTSFRRELKNKIARVRGVDGIKALLELEFKIY